MTVTVLDDEDTKVPHEGPFRVVIHIEPPAYMRHDPKNGKRYAEPVDVVFDDVSFRARPQAEPGRTPTG